MFAAAITKLVNNEYDDVGRAVMMLIDWLTKVVWKSKDVTTKVTFVKS
jgi:hypothetical protein